ncbi:MAG: glycosyltransferase [Bifidobacterium sp.]|jgi:glycosyltransferase involved in cell wall biosynthesis
MMKTSVLIFTDLEYGGVVSALINLLKALNRRLISVTVRAPYPFGPRYAEVAQLVDVEPISLTEFQSCLVGYRMPKNPLRSVIYRAIRKLLSIFSTRNRNLRYQVALRQLLSPSHEHYDSAWDFLGYGKLTTALATAVNATKKATWIHSTDIGFMGQAAQYYKSFDRIFCVSKAVREKVIRQYPRLADKTTVLYNLIDTQTIIGHASQPLNDNRYEGSHRILTIARLAPEKGIDLAVQAAALLKKHGVRFHWFVLGEGVQHQRLSAMIAQLQLTDSFSLLGNVGNPYNYLKRSTIYVQPSRNEGYGITLSEAIIMDKPIIATDIPAFREQISNGINGILTSLDPADLANCIEMLLSHPELSRQFEKALQSSTMDFSDSLQKIYDFLDIPRAALEKNDHIDE